jgi:hypothetical protein
MGKKRNAQKAAAKASSSSKKPSKEKKSKVNIKPFQSNNATANATLAQARAFKTYLVETGTPDQAGQIVAIEVSAGMGAGVWTEANIEQHAPTAPVYAFVLPLGFDLENKAPAEAYNVGLSLEILRTSEAVQGAERIHTMRTPGATGRDFLLNAPKVHEAVNPVVQEELEKVLSA